MNRRSSILTALTAVVFVLSFAAPAVASHSAFIDPDNVDHYIDRNSVTTRASDATVHAIGRLNRSKMNTTVSGSGHVEVYDAQLRHHRQLEQHVGPDHLREQEHPETTDRL